MWKCEFRGRIDQSANELELCCVDWSLLKELLQTRMRLCRGVCLDSSIGQFCPDCRHSFNRILVLSSVSTPSPQPMEGKRCNFVYHTEEDFKRA